MAIETTWSYGKYKTRIKASTPQESWSYGKYLYNFLKTVVSKTRRRW